MILVVSGRRSSGILSSDGAFDPDMREALANAAQRYGLKVTLPSVATLQSNQITFGTARDRSLKNAEAADGA